MAWSLVDSDRMDLETRRRRDGDGNAVRDPLRIHRVSTFRPSTGFRSGPRCRSMNAMNGNGGGPVARRKTVRCGTTGDALDGHGDLGVL